ncbi:MAG TPA: ABC transporter permease [Methylomusa anaerophila]|uniref:Dipeptide transport system permease protein DppB n=1 Tax=Methylomusa anaerophila TaxID=1930071 RepID=A0A348AEZ6_9FIRM|nr:ABC transporter permease [Methylomusa anaerophila]BBB89644.1 dipeptide transport system permease protein DppB [Methylomusa anaerophila]HML89580.1 ABC transporter permease [Methylomusa anaerophila]
MPNAKITTNYLIALCIIFVLNFLLPRLLPGDPLHAIYGDEALTNMTPELQAELIQHFSLDRSLDEQFAAYILSLARADLGYSYFYNAPVTGLIAGFLPWTVLLAGSALILSTLAGIILGIESGYRRNSSLDRYFLGGIMIFSGLPNFFFGIILLLTFSVSLRLLPLSGAMTPYSGYTGPAIALDILHHLVLPLTSLVMVHLTATYLLTRNTMVTVMGEAFIRTARAKGCPDYSLRYRHAGRCALLPVVTATGLNFGHLISSVLLIEVVFVYPGMGTLLYKALMTRDYPLLQGILLLITIIVLIINYLTDFLYARLDPRTQS